MIHDFSYSLMEKFKCPKCLHSSTPPKVTHHNAQYFGCDVLAAAPQPSHLAVSCRRCGYSERMREADQPKPLIVDV